MALDTLGRMSVNVRDFVARSVTQLAGRDGLSRTEVGRTCFRYGEGFIRLEVDDAEVLEVRPDSVAVPCGRFDGLGLLLADGAAVYFGDARDFRIALKGGGRERLVVEAWCEQRARYVTKLELA